MADKNPRLIPEQGWHCLHLFYRIDFTQWQLLSGDEQRKAKTALTEIAQEIRATENTQLLTLSTKARHGRIRFRHEHVCRADEALHSRTGLSDAA